MTIHATYFLDGRQSYINIYENGAFRGSLRDVEDPKGLLGTLQRGGAKVIDLTDPGIPEETDEVVV